MIKVIKKDMTSESYSWIVVLNLVGVSVSGIPLKYSIPVLIKRLRLQISFQSHYEGPNM